MKKYHFLRNESLIIKFIVVSLLLFLIFACKHDGGEGSQNTPNHTQNSGAKQAILETFTIKDADAKSGILTLAEEDFPLQKGEVIIAFKETEAPTNWTCDAQFPLTMRKDEQKKLTFKIAGTDKWKEWKQEVTIKCTGVVALHFNKITVHGKDVKNDEITLPSRPPYNKVTNGDVKVFFDEADAPTDLILEPETLSLNLGDSKSLTISTRESQKYKKFTRTITVKCAEKKEPTVKQITIHGLPVKNGKVLINEGEIEKKNVKLEFNETDAQKEFRLHPYPFTIAYSETKAIQIEVEENNVYLAKTIQVSVTRTKDPAAPQDIDDCVAALQTSLKWNEMEVHEDITLPTTVKGYENSTVMWTSSDIEHCNIDGKIKRDIVDVEVTLTASVEWESKKKDATFKVVVQRYMQIREKKNIGNEAHIYSFDFSNKGEILYKKDDVPIARAELKDVDTTQRTFTLKLLQVSKQDEEGELVDLATKSKENLKTIEAFFGERYRSLMKSNDIKWDALKDYAKNLDERFKKIASDEELFETIKVGFNYNGKLEDFKKLPAQERTMMVKNSLKDSKEFFCKHNGIPTDTEDDKLEENLKTAEEEKNKLKIAIAGAERKVKYKLETQADMTTFLDGILLRGIAQHQNDKAWHEQAGSYSKDSENEAGLSLKIEERFAKKIVVSIGYRAQGGNDWTYFDGDVKDDTFTAKENQGNKTLQGFIVDTKNGNITLSNVTGAFNGTYSLKYSGGNLLSLLKI